MKNEDYTLPTMIQVCTVERGSYRVLYCFRFPFSLPAQSNWHLNVCLRSLRERGEYEYVSVIFFASAGGVYVDEIDKFAFEYIDLKQPYFFHRL